MLSNKHHREGGFGVFDPFLWLANPVISERESRRLEGSAATRGKGLRK